MIFFGWKHLPTTHEESATVACVETAAMAVHAAKLEFLQHGLKADHEAALQMKGALALIDDEQHLWMQKWRQQQEDEARKGSGKTWVAECREQNDREGERGWEGGDCRER